jgi:hypothetical protein
MLAVGDCLWRSGTVADSRMLVVLVDRCGDEAVFGDMTEYRRRLDVYRTGRFAGDNDYDR